MAKSTSQLISNGEIPVQYQHKKPHSIMEKLSRKGKGKPMKSNITNKMKPRHPEGESKEGDGDGDKDGDSSAIEELADPTEEPDVYTLSGAMESGVGGDTPRLAGFKPEDKDMFNEMTMINAGHAVAAADGDADGSDDNYADVENISDSEASDDEDKDEDEDEDEDEQSVMRSAEQDLIDEFERTEQRRNANMMTIDMNGMAIDDDEALARQLSLQASRNQPHDFGWDINMNEDPFFGLAKDDNLYNDMWTEAESAIWRMPDTIRQGQNSDANGAPKRVRFEETHSRDSSIASSEDPNEAFPDLFASSDDPAVKQRLALVVEELDLAQNGFDDAESFYDFEDDDEKFAFEVDENSDSDSDSSSYDSDDEGDTTDEESREEQIAKLEERKRAAGKPADSAPTTPSMAKRRISTTASTPPTPRPTTPKSGKGPKSGTFIIDPTRATMTTDAGGRRIKLHPPSKPLDKDKAFWDRARTANSTRTNSPSESAYLTLPSPAADNLPPPPFTAKSTLGSMFNGNLDILRNNDTSGIAEDLFPALLSHRQPSFTTTTTEESDAERQDINMQDFIDMQASDSDSDSPPSASVTSPIDADMMSSLNSSGLLGHFDQYRGVVGSFRRNQHQARHFSSLASHPAKRASAHEFNALQKGKRGAANTPMTPSRKKRASQDLSASAAGIRKSIGSPLTSRRPRSRGNSLIGVPHANLLQTLAPNPFG